MVMMALPSFSTYDFPDNRFSIDPPTNVWSGDLNSNGTIRRITAALSDFKEDVESDSGGDFSNQIRCRGLNWLPYHISISLDGPLMSGTNNIPASNLKYMLTWTNGLGTKHNYQHYVNFSISPALVYDSAGSSESANPESDSMERELQFKYAIQVPDNQPIGTYTANIIYTGSEDGGVTRTRTAPISITVVNGNLFTLSVDRGTADFETMKPGETKDNVPEEGIIITSMTNTGNPWFLKISNTSPLSAGPYIIPNSDLTGTAGLTEKERGTATAQMPSRLCHRSCMRAARQKPITFLMAQIII